MNNIDPNEKRIEDLEDALGKAVAFIESNAASPDITAELCKTYKEYLDALQVLSPEKRR